MKIILNISYFLVFLMLAMLVMFLGGLSGVAGTFYVMVEPGDLQANLSKASALLIIVWLLILFLRNRNKRGIKRIKRLAKEEQAKEAK